MAHEGKSSVAMELAKSFAEAGNTTLLIDADMRKSVLIGRYKTGAVKYGLSHCLIGKNQFTEAVCETDIPKLYVLFSGPVPPNPSELLGSRKFVEMLDDMRKSFAYIIVDTPPLGSVIDAAVVARSCDGTLLVIENNAISYRFAQKVKEQLDKTGSRILGVVLNKINMSVKGYYGHYGKYYGRYYGKYYGKYYGEYGDESQEKQEKEEQLHIKLQKEFYEQQKREAKEKKEQERKEKRQRRKQKIKHIAIESGKYVLAAAAAVLLVGGLLFGGLETAKAMGKRSLLNTADSRLSGADVRHREQRIDKRRGNEMAGRLGEISGYHLSI